MRRQIVTVGALGSSAAIPVDYRAQNFQIGFGCVVSAGGTLTYKMQHTFDDIYDPAVVPTWFDHSSVIAQTVNKDGNYAFPVAAVRLTTTAYTSGTVTVTLLQSSGQG